MGNLSNQYISQSFQSLLHLGSDTTASATLTEIQDALGNGVGVFVNTAGNLKVNNHISASQVSASILNGLGSPFGFSSSVSTQLQALENITSSLINKTGSYATTGSNTFIGNQNITGDVDITGTLTATKIVTLIESSSVIFSSGSNILGDSTSDTQTLNGLVKVSGSMFITGSTSISGSSISFKGEVSASYISSSRIVGLGNTTVSDFSASVAQQFNDVETYENNNDTKWSNLQPVTESLLISVNSNLNPFTASAAISITNLNQFTASVAGTNQFTASINTYTASANSYTSSNNTKWNTLQNVTSSLISATGSYATTGSNQFTGSQRITGSVYGNLNQLSILAQTASIDMSLGNMFSLNVSGSTYISASNINVGQTINLLLTQTINTGSVIFSPQFKLPGGLAFSASLVSGSQDVITFVAFNSSSLYTSYIKNLS